MQDERDDRYDDEPIEIVGKKKETDGTWWILCKHTPKVGHPDLGEKQMWTEAKQCHAICQACVDDDAHEDEVNFLVKYLKDNADVIPLCVATELAEKMVDGGSFSAVFGDEMMSQFLPKLAETTVKAAKKAKVAKVKPPSVLPMPIPPCTKDHTVMASYVKLECTDSWKFQKGKMWCTAVCKGCKLPFDTETNQMHEDHKKILDALKAGDEKHIIPQVPSKSSLSNAYCCELYSLGKSECMEFRCQHCAPKMMNAPRGGRGRPAAKCG